MSVFRELLSLYRDLTSENEFNRKVHDNDLGSIIKFMRLNNHRFIVVARPGVIWATASAEAWKAYDERPR